MPHFLPARLEALPATCLGLKPWLPHTAVSSRVIGSLNYRGEAFCGVSQAWPLGAGGARTQRVPLCSFLYRVLLPRQSQRLQASTGLSLWGPRRIPLSIKPGDRPGSWCCHGRGLQHFTPPCPFPGPDISPSLQSWAAVCGLWLLPKGEADLRGCGCAHHSPRWPVPPGHLQPPP